MGPSQGGGGLCARGQKRAKRGKRGKRSRNPRGRRAIELHRGVASEPGGPSRAPLRRGGLRDGPEARAAHGRKSRRRTLGPLHDRYQKRARGEATLYPLVHLFPLRRLRRGPSHEAAGAGLLALQRRGVLRGGQGGQGDGPLERPGGLVRYARSTRRAPVHQRAVLSERVDGSNPGLARPGGRQGGGRGHGRGSVRGDRRGRPRVVRGV
mmetsp:Transcript_13845/g.32849  ORF Transcript_13845/g.32849 Transcript_13845/m.32849 type:complete len:209 (-) Transcript_13845:42-668(-)